MPILPCPLGARCTDGDNGGIWKTVDIPFEQAQVLLDKHVMYAHQATAVETSPAKEITKPLKVTGETVVGEKQKFSKVQVENEELRFNNQFRQSFRYWQKKVNESKIDSIKRFSKKDKKEMDLLQQELLDYYRGILPPEISLKFTSYFDDRTAKTECQEFFSEEELEVRRRMNENVFTRLGSNGKLSIPGIGLGVKFHHLKSSTNLNEESRRTKTTTAVVSTTCYSHLKKFTVKPVLDEINFLNTARKIHLETNPNDKYLALNKTIQTIREFQKNQICIPIIPFHCGGSFTIDAIAHSTEETEFAILSKEASKRTDIHASTKVEGWATGATAATGGDYQKSNNFQKMHRMDMDNKYISVSFKHKSDPENCNNVSDVCEKLDRGPEFWSIYPDLTATVEKVPIDILEMMKKHANENRDEILKEVSDFLEQYLEEHTHFMVIGQNHTLKKFLKQISHLQRPAIPSTVLLPDFTVVSFSSLESVKLVKPHKGSSLMVIFLTRPIRSPEDILQEIKINLENFPKVYLNQLGLLIFAKEEETEDLDSIIEQVEENLGIANHKTIRYKADLKIGYEPYPGEHPYELNHSFGCSADKFANCSTTEEFTKVLQAFQQKSETDDRKRNFVEFWTEKVFKYIAQTSTTA